MRYFNDLTAAIALIPVSTTFIAYTHYSLTATYATMAFWAMVGTVYVSYKIWRLF